MEDNFKVVYDETNNTPEDKENCMVNIDLYIKPRTRKCSGCKYYYCEYDGTLSSIYPFYEECTIELKYRKCCKEPEYIFYTDNESGIIKSLWIKLRGISESIINGRS